MAKYMNLESYRKEPPTLLSWFTSGLTRVTVMVGISILSLGGVLNQLLQGIDQPKLGHSRANAASPFIEATHRCDHP